jgi:hypothetical protein
MEYRVVYLSMSMNRTVREPCDTAAQAKVRALQTWGKPQWREPGGVWQTLTEGVEHGSSESDPVRSVAAPSVSVPSVPEERLRENDDPGRLSGYDPPRTP